METYKYKLTGEKTSFQGRTLYRIQALKDFDDVKAGDKGGFIEYTENLSQKGNCWIYDDSIAVGDAWIRDNAKVRGSSTIEDSEIFESSSILESHIYANSSVCGRTFVCFSKVGGNSKLDCTQIINSHILNLKCYRGTSIKGSIITTNSFTPLTGLNIGNNTIILGENNEIRIRINEDGRMVSYYDNRYA